VVRAIHFHDEPNGGRKEIDDSRAQDDLPTKRDAELAAGKALPKPALRLRRRAPIFTSTGSEHVLASGGERVTGLEHGVSPRARRVSGRSQPGASAVTRAEENGANSAERGTAVAPSREARTRVAREARTARAPGRLALTW
jgi:hypothetical protein